MRPYKSLDLSIDDVVGSGVDGEHAQLWEQALQGVEVWGGSSTAYNL
jgi:hypothetical protein